MINILFVCMGNICRSPAAEAVMNSIIKKAGMQDKIKCDSAGTIAYHEGEPSDSRMKHHARMHGYSLNHKARKIRFEDLEKFDYILTMDKENYADVLELDKERKYFDKILMMTKFCTNHDEEEVPDPYYGGPAGFEKVLDLLEDACEGLLNHVLSEHPEL